jgi:hypothetical protein
VSCLAPHPTGMHWLFLCACVDFLSQQSLPLSLSLDSHNLLHCAYTHTLSLSLAAAVLLNHSPFVFSFSLWLPPLLSLSLSLSLSLPPPPPLPVACPFVVRMLVRRSKHVANDRIIRWPVVRSARAKSVPLLLTSNLMTCKLAMHRRTPLPLWKWTLRLSLMIPLRVENLSIRLQSFSPSLSLSLSLVMNHVVFPIGWKSGGLCVVCGSGGREELHGTSTLF